MPAKRVRKTKAKKQGKGFLDVLKKAATVAKSISDATGIKPSQLLATKGPYGAIGAALLQSQGLGAKKSKGRGKKGGCAGQCPSAPQYGQGFFEDFAHGFSLPFKAIGDLGSAAVGGLLGNGKKGRRRGGAQCSSGMPSPYPNSNTTPTLVKF